MCQQCFGRRAFLRLATAGLAAASLAPNVWGAEETSPTKVSPDEALARLKDGNGRFVQSPQLCAADLAKARQGVAMAQSPWATILSCSDSRVPPELVFGGLGLGELFIARNAGNLADVSAMGSIEYGSAVLASPLIVVLAHSSCGAVEAACDAVEKNATYPGSIGPMIEPIIPIARELRGKPGDYVDNVARAAAKMTADRIRRSQVIAGLIEANRVHVAAARYDLRSGIVDYLD